MSSENDELVELQGDRQLQKTILERFADAIANGNCASLQSLIDNGSVDANTKIPWLRNSPALVYAVRYYQLRIARLLLEAGARIDEGDAGGVTACHAAAFICKSYENLAYDMFVLLLSYCPNLDLEEYSGRNVLRASFDGASSDRITALLIDAGCNLATFNLTSLAAKGPKVIQSLIDRGIVIHDLIDIDGRNALHEAVDRAAPDVDTFTMLVNVCGVDVDAREKSTNGFTCAHIAARNNSADTLYWLINAGANINRESFHRVIPLHFAGADCARLLLAAGSVVYGDIILDRIRENDALILHILLAGDYAFDSIGDDGELVRQELAERDCLDADRVKIERHRIVTQRLDFVRYRALEVCVGLQSLNLPALLACEILLFACGPVAPIIPFHHWWQIATIVKHFH
jgi:ankyrin repeat protein